MRSKVICIGDSIARGAVFDSERMRYTVIKESAACIIQEKLNVEFVCQAKFGRTISGARSVLDALLAENTSEVAYLAIEIGGNDSDFAWNEIAENPLLDHKPHTVYDEFVELLISMISDVRAAGIVPVLLNLPPIDADRYINFFSRGDKEMQHEVLRWLGEVGRIFWYHERYNNAISYVGEITNTSVINVRRGFLRHEDYRAFLSVDGIHPNIEGQRIIAEEVLAFITRNAPQLL